MASMRDDATPVEEAGPGRPDAIRDALVVDLRTSGWRQRMLLLLAVGWIGYEWGLGNETVTPWLLSWVISEHDGWSTIALTALVGFGFTFVQQLLSGLSVLAGLSVFDRTASAAWRRLATRIDPERLRWDGAGWAYRLVIVFTLGTTAVALLQIVSSGRVGVAAHRRVVVLAAGLCAAAVGIIGALAATLGQLGRSVDALAGPTDWVLRILGNPLFWIGLLGTYLVVQRLGRSDAAVPALAGGSTPPTIREG